jgi:hypothetical protein
MSLLTRTQTTKAATVTTVVDKLVNYALVHDCSAVDAARALRKLARLNPDIDDLVQANARLHTEREKARRGRMHDNRWID